MLASDVITKFEEYVDDSTELSSTQELDLLQKVFNKIWVQKPWEFAKASVSGTFALTTPNIPKPADFSNFVENNLSTENTVEMDNNAAAKVIFIGANYQPYQIINWSDRRQYRTRSGFAYLDLPNSGITFTLAPTATDTYEFDYKKQPPTLVLGSEIPSLPAEFHDMLYHGMAVDDDIILRFPKAQSYAPDNQARYDSYFRDLAAWNASLQLN
jgi:hypothetical protein